MISRIEALNYRSLGYISQKMENFLALIGPNASGKSTFLDVVCFLHDLTAHDLDYALANRGIKNLQELFSNGKGDHFELAVEADIPTELQSNDFHALRYEIQIGFVDEEPGIVEERLCLKHDAQCIERQLNFFPQSHVYSPSTILEGGGKKGIPTILSKSKGMDHFYEERSRASGKGWFPTIRLGPKRSALSNLYEDKSKFPASLWFKQLLSDGVQTVVLNSSELRKPSPPNLRKGFRTDGSNLPWLIRSLQKDSEKFQEWIDHIKTALPDLRTIFTTVRPEDRHCYLTIEYSNGAKVPSWLVSDGTLRLLALTIPAYLNEISGILLIEEPENGIHPSAIKTVIDSLQSIYDAQVLLATHSPVILGELSPRQILCFGKTLDGMTDIVRGIDHPRLREWQGTPTLDTLFAGGIL